MAEQAVVVEIELGVQRDHATVAGDDQRIDLGERRVGLVECTIQALQHLPALLETRFRNADLARDGIGLGIGEALHRIDEDLVNFLGRLRGDFLDVHAAFRARHQHHALRPPIDDHPDVKLFADVRAFFDQQAPHLLPLRSRLVSDELHAEDAAREVSDLGDRLRDLDAAPLAAAAGVDLRLDDVDAAADRLGALYGLSDRKRGNAARRRHAEAAKDFLALVFVDLHASPSLGASQPAPLYHCG